MSRRGNFGKPYRRPPAGWPKYLPPYSSVYAHKNPTLNGLVKLVNTTQVTLQENQVGRPITRPVPNQSGPCEPSWDNGLPQQSWIGLGVDQFLTSQLPGMNQFTQRGTNDKGKNCRLRGGKWVQAIRHWHGMFGFLSHDPVGCNDTFCTDTSRNHESPQLTPDQTKYLGIDVQCSQTNAFSITINSVFTPTYEANPVSGDMTVTNIEYYDGYDSGTAVDPVTGLVSGALSSGAAVSNYNVSVNPLSGKKTLNSSTRSNNIYHWGTVISTYDGVLRPNMTPAATPPGFFNLSSIDNFSVDCSGTNFAFGQTTALGSPLAFSGTAAEIAVAAAAVFVDNFGSLYGALATCAVTTLSVSNTLLEFQVDLVAGGNIILYDHGDGSGGGAFPSDYIASTYSLSGSAQFKISVTLSTVNASATVNTDRDHLLSFWDLTDDNLYPWRTDGIWQIAPLMTRDEFDGEVSPMTGWLPATVDDLRYPIGGGIYTQMTWFDPAAYGFTRDSLGNVTGFAQYALTGKIFGMPMPTAFTNNESGLYQAGYTPPAKYDFQNYFDYRATIWKAVQWWQSWNGYAYVTVCSGVGAGYVDFYQWGYGEWLYDAIMRTGAQLPHCATQWTNNYTAMMLPPYAYIIQADKQLYDLNGQPGPGSDFATGPTGVMAQKCAEILEILPSYDFARPAAADKFSYDETKVVCTDGSLLYETDGSTHLTVDPGVTVGIWGGQSVAGFFTGCSMDTGTGALTLGTKVFNVPSDWASASGDTATCFGKLRFSTAPAILGRMNVVSLTDLGASRKIETGALTTLGLVTSGTPDAIDICAVDMTVMASNVNVTRVDNTHFTVSTALATIATAKFIVSHAAANTVGHVANASYEWDDNQRKGDYVVYDWLFDWRTNGENARQTGNVDCTGAAITPTAANNGYASFHKTQYEKLTAFPYTPCKPLVVCISPNGENFGTGSITIPFPTTFIFDDRYGARWQMEIESAQTDYLWQPPHEQCGLGLTEKWTMDDGSCPADPALTTLYAHYPLIEARVTVPNYGGMTESDTAPTPPVNFTFDTPVTFPAAAHPVYPPGMIGYDPTTGNPSGAFTVWGYIINIEQSSCTPSSCRFNYADAENLLCLYGYVDQPLVPPDDPLAGLTGLL